VICEHFSNPATVRITGNNSEFQGAKINDKNTICLPRQDLMPKRGMAKKAIYWQNSI